MLKKKTALLKIRIGDNEDSNYEEATSLIEVPLSETTLNSIVERVMRLLKDKLRDKKILIP